jgi:hypothetical protein
MLVSNFRSSFHLTINAGSIDFTDSVSDSYVEFDAASHLGTTVQAPRFLQPIKPALVYETGHARLSGKPSPLMSGDLHDTSPSSHTTGGGRRSFISVAFERHLRGLADGLPALRAWADDQGNRPVCWLPFDFKYDGYYGTHVSGWKYDKNNAAGWDICDPAHLETSNLFAGAALGDDTCLAHFTMLAAWVASSWPGGGPKANKVQRGWHGSNQERARGWILMFWTRAILLGLDTCDDEFRDTFLAGLRPKEHLRAIVDDMLAHPQPLGPDHADNRTMVDLKNGSGEIKGAYGWANGIMFAGIGYLLGSGVLNPPRATQLRDWATARAAEVVRRAVGPTGHVTYAFGGSENVTFTQSDCDLANQIETDKSHVYELVPPGCIRDKPRKPDAELMAGGLALLNGKEDPTVKLILSICDKPGASAYSDRARYLDPAYAT